MAIQYLMYRFTPVRPRAAEEVAEVEEDTRTVAEIVNGPLNASELRTIFQKIDQRLTNLEEAAR